MNQQAVTEDADLTPYLERIDELEERVAELERILTDLSGDEEAVEGRGLGRGNTPVQALPGREESSLKPATPAVAIASDKADSSSVIFSGNPSEEELIEAASPENDETLSQTSSASLTEVGYEFDFYDYWTQMSC